MNTIQTSSIQADEALPSWAEGDAKQSILDFVDAVTKEGNEFVPMAERIAVTDNDGTLWGEQPMYVQFVFVRDRVMALIPHNPEWRRKECFRAVLENDVETFVAAGDKGLLDILKEFGETTEEYAQAVMDWLVTARHPTTGLRYTEMVYQPMLELLKYLRTHGFTTYIISGGGIEFMRPWTESIYDIPPEQVVGSSVKTEFVDREGVPVLVRLPEVSFVDDGPGKPVGINQHIGRRPIAAFGNSDGDKEMLEWTTAGSGRRFGLLVHHTDGDREWDYDNGETTTDGVGELSPETLSEAGEKGWTVVDMKTDWTAVYPSGKG